MRPYTVTARRRHCRPLHMAVYAATPDHALNVAAVHVAMRRIPYVALEATEGEFS